VDPAGQRKDKQPIIDINHVRAEVARALRNPGGANGNGKVE
jgi:hypothetical protein